MARGSAARRLAGGVAIALTVGILGGCVEQAGTLQAGVGVRSPAIVARPGVSPRGASIAVASIEGAPEQIAQRFARQLQAASVTRELTLVDAASANYLVRVYLAAHPVESGAAVAFVWDVFDGKKQRRQRIEDAILVRGAGGNPWALVDERTIATVADRSADSLAAWLTHTPEAIAAPPVARGAPAPAFPSVPGRSTALGYAPLR